MLKFDRLLTLILVAFMFFTLIAFSANAASEKTINIGMLIPMSGGMAAYGVEVKAATMMIQDIINNKVKDINIPLAATAGLPGLHGAKVKFVFGDLSTNDLAMSETERLITQQHCVAITGAFASASTKTAAVSTEKYGVPLLSEGTSVALAKAGYKYYFRISGDDDLFCETTFKYFDSINKTKKGKIKNIALMSEDSEFGKNIQRVETEMAAKYGFKVVANISYNASATNLSSEIIKLKDADPDAVILSSYIPDAILIIRTFKQQNYKPKLIMGQRGGYIQNDFLNTTGVDADGVMSTARTGLDVKLPALAKLADLYKSKYNPGVNLGTDVVTSIADAYIAALAINQARSTKADDIKKALTNLKWPASQQFTVLNGIKCDPVTGQNTLASCSVLQIQEGKFVTVYPDKIKAVNAIFPLPAWKQ